MTNKRSLTSSPICMQVIDVFFFVTLLMYGFFRFPGPLARSPYEPIKVFVSFKKEVKSGIEVAPVHFPLTFYCSF